MSAAHTNILMGLIDDISGGKSPFADNHEMCEKIDATDLGGIAWQKASLSYQGALPESGTPPEWMMKEYELFYRPAEDVVKRLLADPTFDGAFDYVPYQEFDKKGDRRYEDVFSGDWAFKQAVCIEVYH